MSGSPERALAARLLIRVEGGAFSSRLLGSGSGPGVRQRVLGVLRWLRALDDVLARHCRRPPERLDPEVRIALRLGLYEAAVLGVPAAVATDGAVRLVRSLGLSSATGMVNAVLRRSIPAWETALLAAAPDLRLSHPAWLYRRWAERFGEREAIAVMTVDQEPAPLWCWFVSDGGLEAMAAAGVALESHPWCSGAYTAPGEARAVLDLVVRGLAYVQDPASQLVAHVAARLAAVAGGRLADLCAAPGGKLALLHRLGSFRAAVGLELHLGRARLARGPVTAVAGTAPLCCADGIRPPLRRACWDVVLLDAPCSGTGTLRRHPELRWRLEAGTLARLADTQRALLESGLELLAPGGALLYATCSLEPEENEAVLTRLPAGFEPCPLAPLLPDALPWRTTAAGGALILPSGDNDGFTLHAVRRLR